MVPNEFVSWIIVFSCLHVKLQCVDICTTRILNDLRLGLFSAILLLDFGQK